MSDTKRTVLLIADESERANALAILAANSMTDIDVVTPAELRAKTNKAYMDSLQEMVERGSMKETTVIPITCRPEMDEPFVITEKANSQHKPFYQTHKSKRRKR